jgi:hypothetical protein
MKDEGPLKEALNYLDNEFLSTQKNDFDEIKFKKVFEINSSQVGVAAIAEGLQKLANEQLYTHFLVNTKLKYIFKSANECFLTKNFVVLAYLTRAVIEHVATYAYVVAEIKSLVGRLCNQGSADKAVSEINKTRKVYKKNFYGISYTNITVRDRSKPIHVNECIEKLDDFFGRVNPGSEDEVTQGHSFLFHEAISDKDIHEQYGINVMPCSENSLVATDYDFLCDFVHPNYGGNFLVSSGELGGGLIDVGGKHAENLSILFIKKFLRYFLYLKELHNYDLHEHMQILAWLDRANKRGIKASKIFTSKALKYHGDGLTPDTAISFAARDFLEERKMFAQFLKDTFGVNDYKHSIFSVTEDFIIDQVEVVNKKIFVKFKNNLPDLKSS